MKIIAIIALIALLAIYCIWAVTTIDRRSEAQRLQAVFVEGKAALESRDLGAAMSFVSKDYKDDSGLNYERLRALAAQAIRSETQFRLETHLLALTQTDNKATARVRVLATAADSGVTLYARELTVTLRKEKTRHALFIPTETWRVVKFDNLGFESNIGDL
jgi:hypothetical protein